MARPTTDPPKRPGVTTLEALTVASQAGITLAVAVGLGIFAGHWLDEQLHTGILFTLIGAFVGLAGASVSSVRIYRAFLAKGGFGENARSKTTAHDSADDGQTPP